MKNYDANHIATLKRLLCEAAECEAKCPTDFMLMTAFVRNRTHEVVGINTLKRFFNYGDSATPHIGTLNVLARSLGYRGFSDFCEHHADNGQSSDVVLGPHIKSDTLLPSQRIRLRWNPGRECVAEYLGNDTFRVVESQQTKLAPGDTFQAALFALGHAVLLANLVHGNTSFPLYEIGKNGGLTLVEPVTNDEG